MRLLSCFLLLSLWHALVYAQTRRLNCGEFMCGSDKKVLLFTIKANIGKSAIAEFDKTTNYAFPQTQGEDAIPDVFRSSFLNNLPEAIKQWRSKRIVTEMRKNNEVVARAIFDVSENVDQLDSHNWFTTSRLVWTYPYWTGSSAVRFTDMSIKGHRHSHYHRSFYLHHSHGGCQSDNGLMGIGETSNDGCEWVSEGGQAPILFYAKAEGTYKGQKTSVVNYADRFLIYLTS